MTMCSWNRECMFGEIVNGKIILNKFGSIIAETWLWLEKRHDHVGLADFVIMPNHIHGILLIDRYLGGSRTAPTRRIKPLGRILGAFKTHSTKLVNKYRQTAGAPIWQRNYYERIIRDQCEFDRIGNYIVSNPANWNDDENNPINL